MRIALLDPPSYSPAYDHHLASALAARGHEVELLTSPFAFGEIPAADGYRRVELFLPLSGRLLRRAPRSRLRFPLKGAEYVPSVVRLLARVRRTRPAVTHVQWITLPRVDLLWVRRLPRPRVLTAHNVLPHIGEANPEQRRAIYSEFDRIVVHTRRGVDEAVRLGVPEERVVRIHHGTFDAPPGVELDPPTGKQLLFFGLIRGYKGLDTLIRALPKIDGARLVVAGDPLEPVEPLQALAREVGVADRIDWRLGYVAPADLPSIFRDAAVAVFPYRGGESASGALATAIGHGRPAVVSDIGGLGETVREFRVGRAVPPDDPGALAAACAALLGDEDELRAAFLATEVARRALSWSTIAEEHERLYSDLLARVQAAWR